MSGPYLSPQEFRNAATGIDWSSVPTKDASLRAQEAEMLRAIQRATSIINGYCGQKLWATSDVEVLPLPSRRCVLSERTGALVVFTSYSPIIAVDLVRYSIDGVNYGTLSGTPIFHKGQDLVPSYFEYLVGSSTANNIMYERGYIEVTYRSGYVNAKLVSAVTSGASTFVVDDPIGILVGDTITLYDADAQEDVIVAGLYVAGSVAVPTTTPLLFAHAAGVVASEMLPRIKEAAILYATDLIRQRGKDAVALSPSGATRSVARAAMSDKLDFAKESLNPHKRLA